MGSTSGLLSGKTAWITGATGGIGRAVAILFATAGAQVVLAGRNEEKLAGLAAEIAATGGQEAIPQVYDARDDAAVAAAFQQTFKRTRRLDILVDCAGVMRDAPLGMITRPAIDETLNVNVAALLMHMQYAARLMQRSGGGSIVSLSSLVGLVGNANQSLYAASKAAVIGATRAASRELAPKNIRVNALAPGFIDTDLTAGYALVIRQRTLAAIGLGRAGTPEDVAKAALFLASDLSSYITGQVLGVDGGLVLPNA